MYNPQSRLEELKTLYKNGFMSKDEYNDLRNKEYARARGGTEFVPMHTMPHQKPSKVSVSSSMRQFEQSGKNPSKKKSKFGSLLIWLLIIFGLGSFDKIKDFFESIFELFGMAT
jgi:hypothetical protein